MSSFYGNGGGEAKAPTSGITLPIATGIILEVLQYDESIQTSISTLSVDFSENTLMTLDEFINMEVTDVDPYTYVESAYFNIQYINRQEGYWEADTVRYSKAIGRHGFSRKTGSHDTDVDYYETIMIPCNLSTSRDPYMTFHTYDNWIVLYRIHSQETHTWSDWNINIYENQLVG